MKVSAESGKVNYHPITLEITLETAKEAEVFFAIFNYVPLCEVVGGFIDVDSIRRAIDGVDPKISGYPFHLELCRKLVRT